MPRLAPRRGVIARALLGGAAAGLVGGVAALGTALGSLSVAWTALQAAATQLAPRAPDSVWPTTAVGWLSFALAAAAAWGVWRKREGETLAPVVEKIADMGAHFDHEVRRMEGLVERTAAAVRGGITADFNGLGERVKRVELAQAEQERINDVLLEHRADSIRDRQNLTRRLDEMATDLKEIRNLLLRGKGG